MAAATILIVDDNPVNLCVLRALLSRDDYDLIATDCGESALDIVRANPTFDLVIIDVAMPGINGIEVCRTLKKEPKTAHIPVVLISAYRTDEGSIAEGLDAGADGYLTQPVEDVALRAWVRATLRISRLQRELAKKSNAEDDTASCAEVLDTFAKLSHSVNNPLQALYASADLLALELPHEAGSQDLVREILKNAEKVATMVTEASQTAKQLRKQNASV